MREQGLSFPVVGKPDAVLGQRVFGFVKLASGSSEMNEKARGPMEALYLIQLAPEQVVTDETGREASKALIVRTVAVC